MKTEKSPAVRNRLRIVWHFLAGKMTAEQIACRTGVSRATVFAHWRSYRMSGLNALFRVRPVGRPGGMPAVVRQRFDHLARPHPRADSQSLVYVVERERLVFSVLGQRFPAWRISRWLRRYLRENRLAARPRRFRWIDRGVSALPERDRLHYSDYSGAHLSRKRSLLAEALRYASELHPENRELSRHALAVRFAVPRTEVAFNDEPGRECAQVVWNAPAPSV